MNRRNPQRARKSTIVRLEADHEALMLRREGLNYLEIADRLGVSVSTAHARVRRSFDRARAENTESAREVIELELERLDAMLHAIWPAAEAGNLRAVGTSLKINERRMRILGSEREKLELSGSGDGPVAVEDSGYEKIRALLARYASEPNQQPG